MNGKTLKDRESIRRIQIPIYFSNDRWTAYIPDYEKEDDTYRYWGIAFESDWQTLCHVYDSENDTIQEYVEIEDQYGIPEW